MREPVSLALRHSPGWPRSSLAVWPRAHSPAAVPHGHPGAAGGCQWVCGTCCVPRAVHLGTESVRSVPAWPVGFLREIVAKPSIAGLEKGVKPQRPCPQRGSLRVTALTCLGRSAAFSHGCLTWGDHPGGMLGSAGGTRVWAQGAGAGFACWQCVGWTQPIKTSAMLQPGSGLGNVHGAVSGGPCRRHPPHSPSLLSRERPERARGPW